MNPMEIFFENLPRSEMLVMEHSVHREWGNIPWPAKYLFLLMLLRCLRLQLNELKSNTILTFVNRDLDSSTQLCTPIPRPP
jgi:hypothetical protein